ncbi:MAG: CopD family protein [Fimbriimonadia bacterium]|jgi:putative membrane protein
MLFGLLPVATAPEGAVAAHHAAWILHVFGVISWVGGLLSMTILVWRAAATQNTDERRAALSVVRSLHNWAVAPGFLLLLVGGLWSLIVFEPHKLQQGWFHAKLGLVIVLVAVHFVAATKLYDLIRSPEATRPSWLAAVPVLAVLALACILVLIRVQPF